MKIGDTWGGSGCSLIRFLSFCLKNSTTPARAWNPPFAVASSRRVSFFNRSSCSDFIAKEFQMGIKQEIEWFDPSEILPEIDRPQHPNFLTGPNTQSRQVLVAIGKSGYTQIACREIDPDGTWVWVCPHRSEVPYVVAWAECPVFAGSFSQQHAVNSQ